MKLQTKCLYQSKASTTEPLQHSLLCTKGSCDPLDVCELVERHPTTTIAVSIRGCSNSNLQSVFHCRLSTGWTSIQSYMTLSNQFSLQLI